MEALVYMALFVLVLALAYEIFERGSANSLGMKRSTEQIVQAMTAGERWRADVRNATGPLRVEKSPAGEILHLPRSGGETQYRFATNAIWRRTDERADWTQVLDRVQASQMQPDVRGEVTAWRWEIELKVRDKKPKSRPLLTFMAVPASTSKAQ